MPKMSDEGVLLKAGDIFQYQKRPGRVVELRPEGYFVAFDEVVDAETGEVLLDRNWTTLAYRDVKTADHYGALIVERPLVELQRAKVPRTSRTTAELEIQASRLVYMQTVQILLDDGMLLPTRDSFQQNGTIIAALSQKTIRENARTKAGSTKTRGGAKTGAVIYDRLEMEKGRTIWQHWQAFEAEGPEALFANYRNCGKASPYSEKQRAWVVDLIMKLLDEDRRNIKSIVDSIRAAVFIENERRSALPVPGPVLPDFGYDFVRKIIDEIAPVDHAIRTRGLKVAFRNLHAVGNGIRTTRILEVVMVDEYQIDLVVILRALRIYDWLDDQLTGEQRAEFGMDGTPKRVTLSLAIDLYSRALPGFKIVPEGAGKRPLGETLEMVYADKADIADAAGCISTWHQRGAPESIVLDRGANYISDEAYLMLASLGIINFGGPAGKPWIRAYIERAFGTIHTSFLSRIAGRTFSDVVQKGENKPEERATFTLDMFLKWLVRWVVDIYHETPHAGLDGRTPNEMWNESAIEAPPRTATSTEMRLAFGARVMRKPEQRGLLVGNIYYNTDEFQRYKLRNRLPDAKIEVAVWDGNIGAVEVKLADGRWMTVTATDEKWIGKKRIDWYIDRDRKRPTREKSETALRAIYELDREAFEARERANLVLPNSTTEDMDRVDEKFTRHLETAAKAYGTPPALDLLHGEVLPDEASDADGTTAASLSDDELME